MCLVQDLRLLMLAPLISAYPCKSADYNLADLNLSLEQKGLDFEGQSPTF